MSLSLFIIPEGWKEELPLVIPKQLLHFRLDRCSFLFKLARDVFFSSEQSNLSDGLSIGPHVGIE